MRRKRGLFRSWDRLQARRQPGPYRRSGPYRGASPSQPPSIGRWPFVPRRVREGHGQSRAAARHYLRGKSPDGCWGCRTALLLSGMGKVRAVGTAAEPLRLLQRLAGTGRSGTLHGPRPRTLIGCSTDSPTTGCSGLASLAAEPRIVRRFCLLAPSVCVALLGLRANSRSVHLVPRSVSCKQIDEWLLRLFQVHNPARRQPGQ